MLSLVVRYVVMIDALEREERRRLGLLRCVPSESIYWETVRKRQVVKLLRTRRRRRQLGNVNRILRAFVALWSMLHEFDGFPRWTVNSGGETYP